MQGGFLSGERKLIAPAKRRVDLRAKIGHYRNRCFDKHFLETLQDKA